MKKIISYSLYGSNPVYLIGAIENSKLQKIYFPDWNCRFYVDSTVPLSTLSELKANENEIIVKNDSIEFSGSMWRFEVAFDESAEIFAIRDVDDRLSERDRSAVEEWLKSGKLFHIMRDHPFHYGHVIMAGMWGGYTNKIAHFKETYLNYMSTHDFKFWADTNFLRECVWPNIKDNHFAHDEFWRPLGTEHNFPMPRENPWCFVGNKFDENNNPTIRIPE